MKSSKLIFVACVLVFAVSAFGQKVSPEDVQIKRTVQRLVAAQTAFDQNELEAILAPDFVEISPRGEVDDRAKVIAFYSPEAKAKSGTAPIVVDVSEETVRNHGTFAIATIKLTYTMKLPDGQSAARVLRGSYVVRYLNGSWKLSSAQYTPMPPPQPPKSVN
ncbi:MAG TPA: nuclear transport factor 2 family protein [Pyrinomonadaceae bacterium]|nr:nuclear transport factor 2 family protein [Pyrinomonadaceae bacterium]